MPVAVGTYQWYLMVHILGAVVWVGGAVMVQVLAHRLLVAGDALRLAGFARDVEWVGTRVFAPSSLLLLVFGFLLVEDADLGYPFWIVFGLAVFAYSFLVGLLFLGPESGRIAKLIQAEGAESPEAGRRIRRILLVSRVEMVLLVLVVVDMTIKPFS